MVDHTDTDSFVINICSLQSALGHRKSSFLELPTVNPTEFHNAIRNGLQKWQAEKYLPDHDDKSGTDDASETSSFNRSRNHRHPSHRQVNMGGNLYIKAVKCQYTTRYHKSVEIKIQFSTTSTKHEWS
jgi:hypothetical protein